MNRFLAAIGWILICANGLIFMEPGFVPILNPVQQLLLPINRTVHICATCMPSVETLIPCGRECQFMSMGCNCVNLVALDLPGNTGRPLSGLSHCYALRTASTAVISDTYEWAPFIVKKESIAQCNLAAWDPVQSYISCKDVTEDFIPFICHDKVIIEAIPV